MNKMQSVQGLRAIAYICIFLSHCGITKFGGALGVSFFIILSGFLMSCSYVGRTETFKTYSVRDSLRFSISKINKLYPLHVIMTFVALPLLLVGLIRDFSIVELGKVFVKLITNILLIQSWIPIPSIRYSMNNLSWYLCVCVLLYFMFPYIIRFIERYKKAQSAIWASIITYLSMCVWGYIIYAVCYSRGIDSEIVKGLTYNFPIYRLGDFFIGCNIGYYYKKKEEMWKGNYTFLEFLSVILVILCCVISTVTSGDGYNVWWRTSLIYTWSSVFVVFFTVANKGLLTNLLNNKWLVFIGNMSAFTYLIHEMPIRYVNILTERLWGMKINEWLMAVIMFPLSLIVAFVWQKYLQDSKIVKMLQFRIL